MIPDPFSSWLAALDDRHLADLTPSEAARALRALSSCYVERRAKLSRGGALDSAGKRAAFALFYAPLHFLVTREIVRVLPESTDVTGIIDLGCGTGAAGAAWALEAGAHSIVGIDRHPWAVAETNWTYRTFGLAGRAAPGDVTRVPIRAARGAGLILAYTVNELTDDGRARLLPGLLAARHRGARVLVIEPIARGVAAWWPEWAAAVTRAGGRADEWRFPADLPERQRALARAAGLDPRELTARTFFLG